jgi:hypothetical protein
VDLAVEVTDDRPSMKSVVAILVVLLTACSASVTGEPFGRAFGAASAVARRSTSSINSSYTVVIFNRGATCASLSSDAGVEDVGTQYLNIVIARNGAELPVSGGAPFTHDGAQEYSNITACEFVAGRCRLESFATSSVTLTKATDALVTGTFDGTFAAEQVSGTFDAALCN